MADCLQTARIAGPCAKCGKPVDMAHCVGLAIYCEECCPMCSTNILRLLISREEYVRRYLAQMTPITWAGSSSDTPEWVIAEQERREREASDAYDSVTWSPALHGRIFPTCEAAQALRGARRRGSGGADTMQ